MLVGYARVSTDVQNLELQLDALKVAGCERVFHDKLSSVVRDRPGLDDALKVVRAGDTLVVWKLDRLGRTVKRLIELVEELQKHKVQFCSLTERIDTTTAQGRLFFHIMAAMAEMERDLLRERTTAGLKSARDRGRLGGRRPKMTEGKKKSAWHLLVAGTTAEEVAHQLGISVSTLYRHIPGARSNAKVAAAKEARR